MRGETAAHSSPQGESQNTANGAAGAAVPHTGSRPSDGGTSRSSGWRGTTTVAGARSSLVDAVATVIIATVGTLQLCFGATTGTIPHAAAGFFSPATFVYRAAAIAKPVAIASDARTRCASAITAAPTVAHGTTAYTTTFLAAAPGSDAARAVADDAATSIPAILAVAALSALSTLAAATSAIAIAYADAAAAVVASTVPAGESSGSAAAAAIAAASQPDAATSAACVPTAAACMPSVTQPAASAVASRAAVAAVAAVAALLASVAAAARRRQPRGDGGPPRARRPPRLLRRLPRARPRRVVLPAAVLPAAPRQGAARPAGGGVRVVHAAPEHNVCCPRGGE